jgi:Zn-dependent protease with chaperone function
MTMRALLVGAIAAVAALALPAAPGHAQTGAADAIPAAIILNAAERVYSRDVQQAQAKGTLNASSRHVSMVRGVSLPIVAGVGTLHPETENWGWAVSVETREEPVAYCLPGGKILVSTGLVDRPGLTPAELGAVLAHAVAHALSGDDANAAVAHLAREGRAVNADRNRTMLSLAESLTKVINEVPHTVQEERAADTRALELMARLGLDPRPAVDAWRKIARAGGATPPGFLALHPIWSERIGEIEAQMPAMVALYEKTLRERPPPEPAASPQRTPRRR